MNNIIEEEYLAHLKFKFYTDKPCKKICLNQVLPIDSNMSYCAFITELSIEKNGNMVLINEFDTFFEVTNLERNDKNFERIIQKQQLIEGSHSLTTKIKSILESISKNSKYIYIRCAPDTNTTHYWKITLDEFLKMKDFFDDFPVNFGAFDIYDDSNNWFISARDDEPFIYLAAKDLIIKQITAQHPDISFHVAKTLHL
ncbi:hypothetical protein KAR91_41650 [Candidatus Pacearchaeota archaeon]|nr:hypothetical protein [Candidatus Pacearchaeota archaeon]